MAGEVSLLSPEPPGGECSCACSVGRGVRLGLEPRLGGIPGRGAVSQPWRLMAMRENLPEQNRGLLPYMDSDCLIR